MQFNGKTVCVCDCEGSMPLAAGQIAKACDGEATDVATHLCRAQLGRFEETLKAIDGDVVVACTQEAPLFLETAEDLGFEGELTFTNIREKAGWSSEGDKATPKALALLAEATLPRPITGTVELESGGSVLVIGGDDKAWEAAETLAATLTVTLLLKPDGEFTPPTVSQFPVFSGTARSAAGHLGAFSVTVADVAAYTPSSRQSLKFEPASDGGEFEFDLILDLSGGAPLVTSPEKRDGYFNPEPGNPAAVMTALFELAGLTGTFEKPQYVAYDPDICAHARSGIVGCTKCIDACPAGAISPAGEEVAYDANICAGCGNCAGVCPTGAASYLLPSVDHLLTRLRTLGATYRDAGGTGPRLLVHDGDFGEDLISALARFGDGLPASVIPFAVNSVARTGLEFLLSAVAYGYSRISVLVPPEKLDELDSVNSNVDLANTILAGLGYEHTRLDVISERDPSTVGSQLADGADVGTIEAATYLSTGGKRSLISLALGHLHGQAPAPVDVLALTDGAPFGTVVVDVEGCTLCLSCVGACPAGALADNPEMPQLRFLEEACIQCGLCKATCPEKVISLEPRLDFTGEARNLRTIKEEPPFECVRCGKPFGTESTINSMVEKLKGHPMFSDEAALNRLRMCEDCRIIDMAEAGNDPMAEGVRPMPRTTDDYLREREEARRMAREAGDLPPED